MYNIKKNTIVQKLARGDILDAGGVSNAIVDEYYDSNPEGLFNSIFELTNTDINLIIRPNKIHGSMKRELDKDVYIYQAFRYGDYPHFIVADEKNEIEQEITNLLLDKSKGKTHYVVNKINYCRAYRLSGEEEVRINYTSFPNCTKEEFLNETPVITI